MAAGFGTGAISMAKRLVAGEPVNSISLTVGLNARESTLGPGGRYT